MDERETRVYEPAPEEPNLYWTLEHDLLTIVGLYTTSPRAG